MFRPASNNRSEVDMVIDGVPVSVPAGITLAAALLMHDRVPSRINPVDGSARAPHCLMGACFECLVEVDGIEQRACQVSVSQGMQVVRKLDMTNP